MKISPLLYQAAQPLASILLLCLIILSLPWNDSFWLDETITAWIISGSWSELWHRSINFQGQSPLYFALVKLIEDNISNHESALRSLSLVAYLATLQVTYLLAKRFTTSAGAQLTVVFLAVLDPDIIAASSARPYALALLCSLVSWRFFLDWLSSGKTRVLILSTLSTLLAFYFHYLFIALAGFQVLLFLSYLKPQAAHQLKNSSLARATMALTVALAALVVCAIPGLLQLQALSQPNVPLAFATKPELLSLVKVYFPPSIILYLCCGAFGLALILGKFEINWRGVLTRADLAATPPNCLPRLVFCWYLLPPLTFFLLSWVLPSCPFLDRYFLWYAPALALTFTLLVQCIEPSKIRAGAITGVLLFCFAHEGLRRYEIEDWRSAAQYLQAETQHTARPVFLAAGLIETATTSLLTDPKAVPYLSSPLKIYQPQLVPIILPLSPKQVGASEYLAAVLKENLAEVGPTKSQRLFLAILPKNLNTANGRQNNRDLYVSFFEQLGWHCQTHYFGLVQVLELERTKS